MARAVTVFRMTQTTSREWWAAVKASPARLNAWLRDQYRGEATAAERIRMLRDAFAGSSPRAARILTIIAEQEAAHGAWVAGLLRARGLAVTVDATPARYWKHTLAAVADLETGCAVGAHAERMRLERIEEIVRDETAPADIRAVFARILPQERFHERAFRKLAGSAAMAKTAGAHALGRGALGLTP